LTVRSAGAVVALPASRKALALLAYLALSPHPVLRSHLCELLWDLPDDPRGELRWSLSRIRSFLDSPGRHRVETRMDTIGLDLTDCFADVTEIDQAARSGLATIATDRLRVLAALFTGELLEGLEIDRQPAFNSWLITRRHRYRDCRTMVLEQLAGRLPDEDVSDILDQWLQLAPFDLHPMKRCWRSWPGTAACGRERSISPQRSGCSRPRAWTRPLVPRPWKAPPPRRAGPPSRSCPSPMWRRGPGSPWWAARWPSL
jgi:DNA-binding SARP family transcriptional activator